MGRAALIWPAQVRAARALLGLSQTQLAERAGVGLATVQRVEQSEGEVRGTARSILKLQSAFEELGIIFIERDDEHDYGVRLRKQARNG